MQPGLKAALKRSSRPIFWRSNIQPLNDALNKPKNKLGLDYRVALACLGVGLVVLIYVSFWLGVLLMIGLPAALRLALCKDPQIYRLWYLSWFQRAHYDPARVEVKR